MAGAPLRSGQERPWAGPIRLAWRRFRLELPRPLITARGCLDGKDGWLLRLETPEGALGWGEAAPLEGNPEPLDRAIAALGSLRSRPELEQWLARQTCPASLAFALGAALAELDGLPPQRWLPAPAGAVLLPAGEAALGAIDQLPPDVWRRPGLTLKWKVAAGEDARERRVLEQLLSRLPATAQLRLDANGGWSRATAWAWAERLADEPRLQWLEQPLDPADQAGLTALALRLPVALDESLRHDPTQADRWPGWQVRRPSQEGDPRPLLAALQRGTPRMVLSTAFETGIGRRWLEHLAALQGQGPTPTAPGLAGDWQPGGGLASPDPEGVWEAAA
ncbi:MULTISPECIES: o-succinylbenzoate synthase [Aphanothece]|uniref:o-succinylbenzoate synthase n=1 Tax=Aphanothece TaxID=1121 RepID=UPI003984AB3B